VSWDASLFLPGNVNYPAMDYSGPEVEKVDSITQRDIIQFFSKFIQNNFVGVIANAHVRSASTVVCRACLVRVVS
jgi:hypothetical protein